MTLNIKELTALAHLSYIASPYPGFDKKLSMFNLPDMNNIGNISGSPYFMQLSLKKQSGEIITLPNEPLVSISLQKTIVETATVGEGRTGTVKEYICTEDFDIEIKGVCIGENGAYPTEDVKAVKDLFLVNEALEVHENLFFELFDIKKIVLKSFKLDEMVGQEGVQKYSINAVSDIPFFAELSERTKFINESVTKALNNVRLTGVL
ncbi:hypothetical protein DBR40_21615 [Pedobacter sp. KBW01]|uniref:DUF6046 domain-containing protein n=1 Tax=Pedobacter sp. KBW01 TaxID=2153364 RepID=UPI000F5B45C9|nr:DUF6046 domain-containing protein [Pedobacter sp. KBW01]RQO66853.1 hypothetical protein DBR40_21615 [Pedobacter sp. KBW01]